MAEMFPRAWKEGISGPRFGLTIEKLSKIEKRVLKTILADFVPNVCSGEACLTARGQEICQRLWPTPCSKETRCRCYT
jgi:hypothetical protein